MFTAEESERLIGATVVDQASDRIGEVRQVFVDADTDEPAWIGVRVGLFGGEVLVPLEGADWDDEALRAAVPRSRARSAPEIDLDEPLSVQEHERVCRHYGIPSPRHPREDLDASLFEDGSVSYSIRDEATMDDDSTDQGRQSTDSLIEQRELGRAIQAADEQREEGVSGHMLESNPPAIDQRD